MILITGTLIPDALELLKKDFKVEYSPNLKGEKLHSALKNAEGLIIRTETEVTTELLKHAPKLKIICRAGVGVDNIDLKACSEKKIIVMNTPEANRVSAAEHTLALILALAKQIPHADEHLHQGKWDRTSFTGIEIAHKTLGIIGFGNIGKRVAHRAQAFDMDVIAHDPYIDPKEATKLGVKLLPRNELLSESDFVTCHVPLTDETKNMADAAFFKEMKRQAFFVNTSRGKVVVENDLGQALKAGLIRAAAIDVFADEPLTPASPYLALKNVILTPHVAGQTIESQRNMSMHAVTQIRNYFTTGKAENVVNDELLHKR